MRNNKLNQVHIPNELSYSNLKAIIESLFDGIYITDKYANTIMINASYERITGLSEKDVLGKNMRELVKNGMISNSGSLIALEKKRTVTLEQTFKTGKIAMITSTPIFDENGDVVIVGTNVRDFTELYRLREQIEHNKSEEEKLKRNLEYFKNLKMRENIISYDENTIKALVLADKVAKVDSTVVLLGETGVGKEVFAKYIVSNSNRREKNFIKVNCGAIPENLVESELFGYEKGAFTGASNTGKAGLFELADKGTIFLDEIGDFPLNTQVKLLRVLQESEIERIGTTKTKKIDVRIIAATNRNLKELVRNGEFREDLFYRLMVFPIEIPPLRERSDDIVPLADEFLRSINKKINTEKYLSEESKIVLKSYDWPGNIRELRNIIERAAIISTDNCITPDAIPVFETDMSSIGIKANSRFGINRNVNDLKKELKRIEKGYINDAYQKYGNVRDAAKSLGMSPSTFVRKMH